LELRPWQAFPYLADGAKTRSGTVVLDMPAVDFTAIVDGRGSHLTVSLTRHQAEQARAVLYDVLSISNGGSE
jgi:hypothetical protein